MLRPEDLRSSYMIDGVQIEMRDKDPNNYIVETNVFDIPQRLKQIDDGYFVVYNRQQHKYEIHNSKQLDSTYCLTVPFDELDSRTIDLVHKTKIENAKAIIAGMIAHNAKIKKDRENSFHDYVDVTGREIFKYCQSKASTDRIDSGAYKSRFV